MRKSVLFLALTLLVILPGYSQMYLTTFKVTGVNPQPNLALKASKQKLCIVFDDRVQDEFDIEKSTVAPKTSVSEWQTSLKKGFVNGFGEFFTIVEEQADADLILKVVKADPEWEVASYNTVVSGSAGNVSSSTSKTLRSKITFRASLLDKDGESINQCANTAISKKAAGKKKEINPNFASAIESMYEVIGQELFE